jgi:hypothetical protein
MSNEAKQIKEILSYFETASLEIASLAYELAGDKLQAREAAKRAASNRAAKARAGKGAVGAVAEGGIAPKKRHRRTKAEMEAAKLQAESGAQQAQLSTEELPDPVLRHRGEQPAGRSMSIAEQEAQLAEVAE